MSMPQVDHGRSTADAALVVTRARGRQVALAVGFAVVALVALVVGLQASRSGRTGIAALCAFVAADGVITCIVFAELARRAGVPLLVVDGTGVTTGRLPRVHLTWAEVERVRVFEKNGYGVIGVVPHSVDTIASRVFPQVENAQKYAARLRSFAETRGAPIVVSLRGTSLDAAAAATALKSLAAGRTDITG